MIQENLSVLAYANGFTLWHYKDTSSLATITASTFFTSVSNILNVGDMILINAGADCTSTVIAFITAVSSSAVTLSTIAS